MHVSERDRNNKSDGFLSVAHRMQLTTRTPEQCLVIREWQTRRTANCLRRCRKMLEMLRTIQVGRVDIRVRCAWARKQRRRDVLTCRGNPRLRNPSEVGSVLQPNRVKRRVHWSLVGGTHTA